MKAARVPSNLGFHTGFLAFGDIGPNDDSPTGGRFAWVTLTPGYRQQWRRLLLQGALAGGGAYSKTLYRAPASPIGPPPAAHRVVVVPDLMLGIGLRL